jgi:DNA-binding GntR family transcriptional regulator
MDADWQGHALGIYQKPESAPASSLSDHAFAHLRWRILSGEFTSGQKIRELTLSQELDVSRATIREATRRLSGAGLLEIDAQRGVFVRTYTLEQIEDIIDVRRVLCELTASSFLARATPANLDQINTLYERLTSGSPESYRDENYITALLFNEAVLRAAHNERLFALYHEAWQQIRVFKLHLLKHIHGTVEVRSYDRTIFLQGDAHRRELFAAISNRDQQGISRAMRASADSSLDRARAMFREYLDVTKSSWREKIVGSKASV